MSGPLDWGPGLIGRPGEPKTKDLPSWNLCESIEGCNATVCEQTSHETANKATDTMDGEDIEGIVVSEESLEFCGIIASYCCHNSDCQGCRASDVSAVR